jgi:tetratricopeptide (TPR) repeat protein
LDPANAIAYNNRGVARVRLAEYQVGIADLVKALGLQPDIAEAYYYLGKAEAALGDGAQAEAHYQTACRLDKKYVEQPYR